jgi:hypothetical protein
MAEIKYDPRLGGADKRIHDRLKNSGGENCDVTIKTGEGARRTFHNIHRSGQQQHVPPSDIRTTPTPKDKQR